MMNRSRIAHGFGLRTSDFGLRTSVFGLRTSDFGLRTSVFGLRTSVFGLRTSVFGLLLILAGCATLARSTFATPTVELKDIRMKSIGFQGGSMDIVLNVTNPNDYRLDATHLTYNLFVDTMKVAFGEIHKTTTLEPHRKNEVIVPVSFSMQELMRATQLMTQTGGVDYHVTGEVTAATPSGSYTRAYAGEGHFDNIGSVRPH